MILKNECASRVLICQYNAARPKKRHLCAHLLDQVKVVKCIRLQLLTPVDLITRYIATSQAHAYPDHAGNYSIAIIIIECR